jgi:flagella basal body P-ring formation protein FlgA
MIVIQPTTVRKCILPAAAGLLFLLSFTAVAGEWQSMDEVTATVERFVHDSTADVSGEVVVTVTRPDTRLHLGRCGKLETWLPNGNRLWGRASVGVRCQSPAWSFYVPVMVKVTGNALVTTRTIGSGQLIDTPDVQLQQRDLTHYPGGVFTRPEQVVGKTAVTTIRTDSLLKPELLRSPLAIKQGQQVILVAQGAGFKVSSEGQAMGNAAVGQVVAVKTRSGQTIKGIAKGDGVVEVYF